MFSTELDSTQEVFAQEQCYFVLRFVKEGEVKECLLTMYLNLASLIQNVIVLNIRNDIVSGDPGCIWSEGKTPSRVVDITHPGICEPVDSPRCSFQTWVSCTGKKENCTGRYEAGVRTTDVRFPRTKVPAQLTTYYCKTMTLPHDQDYHITATEPVLDNTKVIHHMLLYGCDGDMEIEEKPFNCVMGSDRCKDLLAGWTVGSEGSCSPVNAGFRFGKSVYKYIQLQVHWTNDAKTAGMYDSSGIRLYYTPNLRKYDLGKMMTGQMHLELPPGKKEIITSGTCSPSCTKSMLDGYGSINITGASLHAHFLGRSLSLVHIRNGKQLRYLAKDDVFSYNNPTSTSFQPPVQFLPGDELRTTCTYDTTKRQKTTYYGDGTYDEMCFGFFDYYPKIPRTRQRLCIAYERYTFCDMKVGNVSLHNHKFGTCDFKEFEEQNYPANILTSCGPKPTSCSKDCKYYVDKMTSHRCMKGGERNIYNREMKSKANHTAQAVWKAINVCGKYVGSAAPRLADINARMIASLVAFLCIMLHLNAFLP
eukprot:gene7433-13194_t